MKIRIMSDIHNHIKTFQPSNNNDNEAEVVILADDIDVKGRSVPWIERAFPGKVVLLVFGNHEFYDKAIPDFVNSIWPTLIFSFGLPLYRFFGCVSTHLGSNPKFVQGLGVRP